MKFFITSITVLVLYAASSVVAAPLPAHAIVAYDGNMMKRDLSGVVDLERRSGGRRRFHGLCRRNGHCHHHHPPSDPNSNPPSNPNPNSNLDPNSIASTNPLESSLSSAGVPAGVPAGDSALAVDQGQSSVPAA
ncbi:hypothetical protein FRC18_011341 [Serendipita sp. 400]|nr:hypothetical protein FRC18_011341 [Serendipita sp. 400]